MACYVVMEPPGRAGSGDAVLVRDRFSWLAFLVPPLWLLWHRLWFEALLAVAVLGLLVVGGERLGFGPAGFMLALLAMIYAGLDGPALRLAALRRRGWSEKGVVEAGRLDSAEIRYALAADPMPAEQAPARPRIVPDPALARPAQTGLALGLTHLPGRS